MIILIGDIHADFQELTSKLQARKISNANLIQVGDFGVGFKNPQQEQAELNELNNFLVKENNLLYVIRGNHDNPAYFTGWSHFSNITYLADYSVLTLDGKNILFVGGAISVDRTTRTAGVNYWTDEKFSFNAKKLAIALEGVSQLDLVVTHTAPKAFWPFTIDYFVKHYARIDASLLDELSRERNDLNSLILSLTIRNCKPKNWYYGHFHTYEEGEAREIKYRALGIMELHEIE